MAKKAYKVQTPFRVNRDLELKIGQRVFAANSLVVLDEKVAKSLGEYLVPSDEVVERATAAPGEKRTSKPRKKNAGKDSS